MRILKRIDAYLLKNFLGLFLLTFLICIFILLMQFLWMHVKDLVGKGVEVSVLAEFFVYAAVTVVPLALPLAILLASLISFSNLGEKFELTAMKAAGVSLFRIMRPLVVLILFICVGAFFFSNNVLPKSQVKLWTLIFSLRQKSPELDIPVGEFYDGISGYNIYVGKKNHKTGMLYDVMLYDLSEGFRRTTVMVADSAQIYFTADNKYLSLVLYNGESFENLKDGDGKSNKVRKGQEEQVPYRRESFKRKVILIDFDTDFNRFDESVLRDQHVAKNASQLVHSIDSVKVIAHNRSHDQSADMVKNKYFGRERMRERQLDGEEALSRRGKVPRVLSLDSLVSTFNNSQRQRMVKNAIDKAKQQGDAIEYNALLLDDSKRYIRKHEIELHRKFTLAVACLIFFFIGAPLGAIIRKGGLGAPVVISVVMFIIYYIIDNTGFKMAREALWPVWTGMWLSTAVLLPIGLFLTYKAATDSALLNPEAWIKQWEKLKEGWTRLTKRIKKETKTNNL